MPSDEQRELDALFDSLDQEIDEHKARIKHRLQVLNDALKGSVEAKLEALGLRVFGLNLQQVRKLIHHYESETGKRAKDL